MKIIFSDMEMPKEITKSIFLAGPSPRSSNVYDWKTDSIKILKDIGFDGTVFLPVPKNKFYGGEDSSDWTYYGQIDWETKARAIADKIVFWVPRNIKAGMPGFTTNVEFGEDLKSHKMLYGRPENADKCRYLDERVSKKKEKVYSSLKSMLLSVKEELGAGSKRVDGEIHIPLFIWNTKQFQSWYSSLKNNGNKLLNAEVKSCIMVGNNHVFSFSLWVDIFVEKEQRRKPNETVFFRTDISSVVAFHKSTDGVVSIVLVEEFRSPVNNKLGRVLELPSGSSLSDETELENAQKELEEETTLLIEDINRFKFVSKRQMVSTFCSYKNTLYCVEISQDEIDKLVHRQNHQDPMGNDQGFEKTFIRVIKEEDLFNHDIDHSNLGMILEALKSIK